MERSRYSENGRKDNQRLVTLFVDNIPASKDQSWLEFFFSNYGLVRDSFIPDKRSKRGSRFGFVRYDCSISAGMAILRVNGLEVEGNILFVKRASFDIHKNRKWHSEVELNKPREDRRQNCMGYRVEEGKSYAQATIGGGCKGNLSKIDSIQIQPLGNRWLFRSAVAKIRKLMSTEELEKEFRLKQFRDVQIRAMGGRFVIITFPNEEIRNATIKEKWVMNWFEEIKPWNGEQANDEHFVWLSCFGMPLNAWSSQTFKKIGGLWGHFLKVDDNTLNGKSYEKGKILIATKLSHKVEGIIELIIDGMNYNIRVEEEESFRKIVSNPSFIDLEMEAFKKDDVLDQQIDVVKRGSDDLEASHNDLEKCRILSCTQDHGAFCTKGDDGQELEETIVCESLEDGEVEVQSQVIKVLEEPKDPIVELFASREVLEFGESNELLSSFAGDDRGLIKEGVEEPTIAVHKIDDSRVEEDQLSQAPQGPEYVPLLDRQPYEKSFDISDDDPISLANKTTVDYDSNDGDLVSADPLIKYVDFVRHKKKRRSFKGKRRKPNRSYNPLIDVMVSRNISRRLNLGSKKSSDGPTPLSPEEEDSRFGLSRLIKQARESIQQTAKLGVKFYGRESYNIKKFLELNGVFISEQDIVALGEVEIDDSLSLEF